MNPMLSGESNDLGRLPIPVEDLPAREADASKREDWIPLFLFNLYRVVLGGVLLSGFVFDTYPGGFLYFHYALFLAGAVVYFAFGLANLATSGLGWLPVRAQVLLQGLADILLIALMMHAAGGVSSGLGMLLVVSIAGTSILSAGRTAIFFAAVASLVVLLETVLSSFYFYDFHDWYFASRYTHAGLLGVTFFATAILFHVFARRTRLSEALARQRGVHLQYLAQVNEEIVQNIQSGIIVIDAQNRIRLFNQSATRLLGLETPPEYGRNLSLATPEITEILSQWRQAPGMGSRLFHPPQAEVDLLVSFSKLSRGGAVSILIVVEDATLTTMRAQELKLASLGRLTASIAHEIRNPLGAISHAGQLLAESPGLEAPDQHLVEIVLKHCRRVNTIVENVLQLSRQRKPQPQLVALNQWVHGFVDELREHPGVRPEDVELYPGETETQVQFDPVQMHQVVWNLCDNGLRYSAGSPKLILRTGLMVDSKRAYLDVRDHGGGIDPAVVEQIFEPFFTTEARGTGLGLYLSRELCERNQATLHLLSNNENGCVFRISFASLPEEETTR